MSIDLRRALPAAGRVLGAARRRSLLLGAAVAACVLASAADRAEQGTPEALYRTARAAFDDKRFDEALPLFRDVTSSSEAREAAWSKVYVGRCLYELDRPGPAARALEDVIRSPLPDDVATSARYWLGRSYYRLNEFIAAAPLFAEVALDADNSRADDALYFLARCQHRGGRYREAEEVYRAYLRLYPDADQSGDCRHRLEQVASALEERRGWEVDWTWENGLISDSNVSRQADGPSDTIWVSRLGVEAERWTDPRTRWVVSARGDRYDYFRLDERDREGYRVAATVRRDLGRAPPLPAEVDLTTSGGQSWLRLAGRPLGDRYYAGVYRFTSQRGEGFDLDYATNQAWASYYRALNSRDVLRLGASARSLEYEDDDRSGLGGAASIGLTRHCASGLRLDARYEACWQDATQDWFAYEQHRLLCSAELTIDNLGRWTADYEFRVRDFDAADPDIGTTRRDDRRLWRLEFTRPVRASHELAAGAEWRSQTSSSPLHDHSVRLLYSHFRWTF